jgi:transposase
MNLYIGIDWSSTKHDAVITNEQKARVAMLTFPHSVAGFAQFDALRDTTGVAASDSVIGIETASTLLIDFLWDHGYDTVYIVPPLLVKTRRRGVHPSGAHTDESDAALLADIVREKPKDLPLWKPDRALTRQIRAVVSLRLFLVIQVVRTRNRLASVLERYYPAALCVFSDIQTQTALQFVRAYPTPAAAAALGFDEFSSFATTHGYHQRRRLAACYARLQRSYPVASPDTVSALSDEAAVLAGMLLDALRAMSATEQRLGDLFAQHEDRAIFSSLPGAGAFLAPALLAKFGDDRARFPSASSVQALAGTCPVTAQSGKRRVVCFRHACDREFRTIAQQWARCSLAESPWAMAYYEQHLARGHTVSHALRSLANRWLDIAWTVWQQKVAYNPRHHQQDCTRRSQPSVT